MKLNVKVDEVSKNFTLVVDEKTMKTVAMCLRGRPCNMDVVDQFVNRVALAALAADL